MDKSTLFCAHATAYRLNPSILCAARIKHGKSRNPVAFLCPYTFHLSAASLSLLRNLICLRFRPAAKKNKLRHFSASKTFPASVSLNKIESAVPFLPAWPPFLPTPRQALDYVVLLWASSLPFVLRDVELLSTLVTVGPAAMLGVAPVQGSFFVS